MVNSSSSVLFLGFKNTILKSSSSSSSSGIEEVRAFTAEERLFKKIDGLEDLDENFTAFSVF